MTLRTLVTETGADMAKFCAFFKVVAVENMLATDFKLAITQLDAKRKRQAEGAK